MKKAIALLALVASMFTASAFNVTPVAYCSSTGYITFNNTTFVVGPGNSAFFYITSDGNKKSANNTYVWTLTVNLSAFTTDALNDSVGAITSAGFLLNIPESFSKNSSNTPKVFATETSATSGTFAADVASLTSLTNGCGLALPITFSSVQAKRISGNEIEVAFTVATVTGVNTVKIQVSFDGGITYVTRAIVFPDGTLPNRTYVVRISAKQ